MTQRIKVRHIIFSHEVSNHKAGTSRHSFQAILIQLNLDVNLPVNQYLALADTLLNETIILVNIVSFTLLLNLGEAEDPQ
jgi:hypothetical protein